jgi:putative ABC transport system permease protein
MNDLRYALRQLWKEPRFTIVAVLALAIGIGANTAIFSVVNAVLLKPLPFPHPEQLVAWGSLENRPDAGDGFDSVSYPDFFDFRAQNKSFSKLAVHRMESLALVGEGPAQSLSAEKVSGDFFDVLDVRPALGRTFTREEEKAGGGPGGLSVMLSHGFWQSHFRGDRAILGKSIILDGRPFTVIGVMPPDFSFPIDRDPADIFVTIALDASTPGGDKPPTEQRGYHLMQGVGRLKPGVTAAQAGAELRTIAAALARQYPDSNTKFSAGAAPLREDLVGDVARGLYVLFGAVGCVLLIASANVANLLLARATVRQKEIALRSALGASRGRIVRQLLTESVLLAAIGGACGLLLAIWGTGFLISLVPENIPRAQQIHLDGAVLAFTFLASLGTGVLFGLAPALQSSRLDLRGALNESSRGSSSGHHRLRNALVVLEVALALLLLTGAGLLLQSFARLSHVNPGVQPERLFTAAIALPEVAYPKPERMAIFQDQLLTRIRALPGVRSASSVFPLPLSGSNVTTSFDREEHPKPEGQRDTSPLRIVGSNYFQTMGVSLVRGRLFNESDRFQGKPVIIINERFAEKFFPNENPIGKRIQPGISLTDEDGPMREIVGVVTNVKHQSLRLDFTPEMYVPGTQFPIGLMSLVVRAQTSRPAALTGAIRNALAQIDPGVPLTRVKMFDEYLAQSLARPRFNALLLSIFAGVALLLTAIGIYGVMAYSVAQRRQEIGIRMALGAQRGDVLRLVVGGGMKLTAAGVLIGVTAAYALTRFLGNLLYGVPAFDGLTFGAVALLLGAIALLACWLPAHRAAGVNPVTALHTE